MSESDLISLQHELSSLSGKQQNASALRTALEWRISPLNRWGKGAARRFWRGLAFAEAQPVAKGIVNLEGFSPRLVHDFRPPVAVILVS